MGINADRIMGQLQQRLQKQAPGLVDRMIQQYVPRLIKDINRIAAARSESIGSKTALFFTASVSDDLRTIVLTPSDPVLFKKLEFGEFDGEGRLKSPPHSVIEGLRVLVRF